MIMGSLFNFSLRKQNKNSEQSLSLKYYALMQLLKENKVVLAEKPVNKSYFLKLRENNDQQSFTFTEVDDRVIIVWKLESAVFGKRGKEWSFNQKFDQAGIFKEIRDDIAHYQRALFKERS
jgi:hypothetical protein